MNRGRRHHHHMVQLFEPEPLEPKPIILRRGRNQQLLSARNKKIVYRYYYYAKINKINYDELLKSLVLEFDISSNTISKVLFVDNYDLVTELMHLKPTKKDLKKEIPYFNWQ